MELLTEAQIEKLFTEPFGDLTLRYANALHSMIDSYHFLLGTAPIEHVKTLNRNFLQRSLSAIEQCNIVRLIIIREELEVFDVYKCLIEQEETWSRLKDITLSAMIFLDIGFQ